MNKQVILCVDDEKTILKSLKTELKQAIGEEYMIEIAEGGEEALEVLQELLKEGHEIPLIISDYVMPDMKGDELLRRVHDISPQTLKVMLTGQATIEAVGNAIQYARLYRYIAKPWASEDLRLTVTEAINSYMRDKQLATQNARLQQMNQELLSLNADLKKSLDAELELTDAASRFVPKEFLSLLGYESIANVKLGEAVQQTMSVMFADIRNFTTMSEKMSPEDNFKFINGYLRRMEPFIVENKGFIDKFIGDEIMALFAGSADDAVKAAIAMLRELTQYNTTRQRPDRPPIQIGIGINTGSVMLGTVGSSNRMDGTAISDTVNLASRLENLTKEYGTSILISHFTLSQLQEPMQYKIRFVDRVITRGKSQPIAIFEVLDGYPPEVLEAKLSVIDLFDQGVLLFHRSRFQEAAHQFRTYLETNISDRPAQVYLERSLQRIG